MLSSKSMRMDQKEKPLAVTAQWSEAVGEPTPCLGNSSMLNLACRPSPPPTTEAGKASNPQSQPPLR